MEAMAPNNSAVYNFTHWSHLFGQKMLRYINPKHFAVLILFCQPIGAQEYDPKIEPIQTLSLLGGKDEFSSISALQAGNSQEIYILDAKRSTIFAFSRSGRPFGSIGNENLEQHWIGSPISFFVKNRDTVLILADFGKTLITTSFSRQTSPILWNLATPASQFTVGPQNKVTLLEITAQLNKFNLTQYDQSRSEARFQLKDVSKPYLCMGAGDTLISVEKFKYVITKISPDGRIILQRKIKLDFDAVEPTMQSSTSTGTTVIQRILSGRPATLGVCFRMGTIYVLVANNLTNNFCGNRLDVFDSQLEMVKSLRLPLNARCFAINDYGELLLGIDSCLGEPDNTYPRVEVFNINQLNHQRRIE